MKKVSDIIYNVSGQSLTWDAPEGRPNTVVASQIFPLHTGDDGTPETATNGSATVEADPNTTFDATSGAGQSDPRLCHLTATTGIEVGRTFLVTNSSKEKEWVSVVAVTAGNTATARHALRNKYESGDSFVSTRIVQNLADSWVSDKSKISDDTDPAPAYRWRLVYEVDGETYAHDLYFDLVRYPGEHSVTGPDVDRLAPGWVDSLPTDYRDEQGQALIDEAYEEVTADLYAAGIPDEMIRSEVVDRLVAKKAVALRVRADFLADPGGSASIEKVEVADRDYDSFLDRLVRTITKVPVADDKSGAGAEHKTGSIWRR